MKVYLCIFLHSMSLAWRVCLAAAAAVTMIKGQDGAAGDDPVTIKDHGYRNVLVAISGSVKEVEDPDDTLIEGIKVSIHKTEKKNNKLKMCVSLERYVGLCVIEVDWEGIVV